MSTTSLKLPEELKGRIAAVAEKSNRSPHAMMLDMLERGVTAQEQRQDFVASALASREEFARTRMGFEPDELFAYLEARIKGLKSVKPKPKKWPK
jgi:predicted transcriptional regulator